jgi:hypothetical protein
VVEACPHSFGKLTRDTFWGNPVEVWNVVGNLNDEMSGLGKARIEHFFFILH